MISRSVFIRAKCRAEATVSYLPSDTCRAEIYRRQHNSCWSRRTLAISPADHPAGKLLSPDRPEHRRRSQCTQRSEERRVGKECRSRWSPYDDKKKRKRERHGTDREE